MLKCHKAQKKEVKSKNKSLSITCSLVNSSWSMESCPDMFGSGSWSAAILSCGRDLLHVGNGHVTTS